MARKSKKSAKKDQKASKDQSKQSGKAAWKLLDRGSTVAAGMLAPQLSAIAWQTATGRKPPVSGRNPEVDTREAVAWAIVGGALVELTKVLVRRSAARYWVKSTGALPPGMKSTGAQNPPATH